MARFVHRAASSGEVLMPSAMRSSKIPVRLENGFEMALKCGLEAWILKTVNHIHIIHDIELNIYI